MPVAIEEELAMLAPEQPTKKKEEYEYEQRIDGEERDYLSELLRDMEGVEKRNPTDDLHPITDDVFNVENMDNEPKHKSRSSSRHHPIISRLNRLDFDF